MLTIAAQSFLSSLIIGLFEIRAPGPGSRFIFYFYMTVSMAWEESHVMTKIMTATLVVTYIPASVPSMFALNVGKRSTLITSEERDISNCTEYLVLLVESNCHGSPFHLLCKHDSRSSKMTGRFLLSWEALVIPFMTITQSRSELFFIAVPFAIDPPYKDKVGMLNLFNLFCQFCALYISNILTLVWS